jgi:hypothetical protein
MRQTIDEMMTTDVRTVTMDSDQTPVPIPTVVLDTSGQPYKLVTEDGVYPAVVVASGTGLADLAASRQLVRTVTRAVPGVVLVDEGQVAGFVPRQALVDGLLAGTGLRGGDDTGSDPLLYGQPRPISGAVRIRCLTCGTVNAYDFYLPGSQKMCQNGHPLDADVD